ncbi:maleylpyruvate isomerase family mycothiol-dependent enzyme [Kitasatospora sp. NPDC049258]|uniref:maleylpyruvate isomerase family mycothiol-dependent enzyme n=1 Tax=Kitasatospora sp. NPDC049258 TaxID=3155394 RepID=UPI003442D107
MKISEYVDALRHEGALLADAAARTAPDAPVPTCPDWRLRDLVTHTGQVHRWATAYVRDGHRGPLDEAGSQAAWGPVPADRELVEWFRDGHGRLVAALEQAPRDLDCWSFLPAPSPLAFWARRQAHETAVHRADAESAAGSAAPTPTDPAFAEDGLAELLTGFVVRPWGRLRSERPRRLLVRPTDRPASWLVTISQEPVVTVEAEGPADCTLSGRADDLYLLLWNRLAADRVEVTGDRSVLDLWRQGSAVTWS